MAPGTKPALRGLRAVTVGQIPGHLQMGGTRTAARFFAATRHARVLGCAAGLLVGVLGPPAVVGDLGSCPAPVVILPYGLRGRGVRSLAGAPRLERDDFSSSRHPALFLCSSLIFSETR